MKKAEQTLHRLDILMVNGPVERGFSGLQYRKIASLVERFIESRESRYAYSPWRGDEGGSYEDFMTVSHLHVND